MKTEKQIKDEIKRIITFRDFTDTDDDKLYTIQYVCNQAIKMLEWVLKDD